MYPELEKQTDWLTQTFPSTILDERRIGLEKESLRVTASGDISLVDHPRALGCALSHPTITTDFSEALLELVTPPCRSAGEALNFLNNIHQHVVNYLPDGEHIWNTSMPCILRGDDSIRVGEYGTSYNGQMKHIYRQGLALRYGKRMQAIAGIHFNFSFPDELWIALDRAKHENASDTASLQGQWKRLSESEKQTQRTRGYFAMTANLLRIGWIVPYLFGASPAICSSFLDEGEGEGLETWNTTTRYAPFGTSLRMGKFGYRYREDKPIDLSVRHTSFDHYIADIIAHVRTEHPPYAELGTKSPTGKWQQLNVSRLQIENEYYSSVRPKQIPEPGELPVLALKRRGIRYLELRSLDVNLFEPAGIGLHDLKMLELLMVFAALLGREPLSDEERQVSTENIQAVAHAGRSPDLMLQGPQGPVSLKRWGMSILNPLLPVAKWLDGNDHAGNGYVAALQSQIARVHDASLTPSSQMLEGIKSCGSFFEFSQQRSKQHHANYLSMKRDQAMTEMLEEQRVASCERQLELENRSTGGFERFLADWMAQIKES